MNVLQLFERLSYGELSNLSISNEGSGEIIESKHPMLVNAINTALLRLYSRFILRENDLVLEMLDHITDYRLVKKHAWTERVAGSDVPTFIMDNELDPFLEDVIKILQVSDAYQNRYALNDINNPISLYTPQPDVLQVPAPSGGIPLAVVYQSRHPILTVENLEDDVYVPVALEEALTAMIAFHVYTNMNGPENSGKAAEHLARYEAICNEVSQGDLVNTAISTSSSDKFRLRGWA